MARTVLLTACAAALAAVAFASAPTLRRAARHALSPSPLAASSSTGAGSSDAGARAPLLDAKTAQPAPPFAAGNWINSAPLTLESLRGRVVVVDFWTFACFNCRNTLPALKRLHETYSAKGLTVVGVHTPELDRERVFENVRREVASLGVAYPVLTDNDYATWNAYGVEAWPTVFILDRAGRVRYKHVGEGAYDEQERAVKTLLAEDYNGDADKTQTSGATNTNANTNEGAKMNERTAKPEEKIVKSDEEWRKELTPEQFHVMREGGTERAFTGAYYANHEKGEYLCAACGYDLFGSDAKFDSGTGWPSFYQPAVAGHVETVRDTSYGMVRTEVRCARCGAHLGHVFDDGPRPTGLRYCINSVSLKFVKKD